MNAVVSQFMKPAQGVATSVHEDGIVLLHAGSGRLFGSNNAGALIWRGLERELPVTAIAADIASTYRLSHDTALDHVHRFLRELVGHRLVVAGRGDQ
jgi:hypothetical protein